MPGDNWIGRVLLQGKPAFLLSAAAQGLSQSSMCERNAASFLKGETSLRDSKLYKGNKKRIALTSMFDPALLHRLICVYSRLPGNGKSRSFTRVFTASRHPQSSLISSRLQKAVFQVLRHVWQNLVSFFSISRVSRLFRDGLDLIASHSKRIQKTSKTFSKDFKAPTNPSGLGLPIASHSASPKKWRTSTASPLRHV